MLPKLSHNKSSFVICSQPSTKSLSDVHVLLPTQPFDFLFHTLGSDIHVHLNDLVLKYSHQLLSGQGSFAGLNIFFHVLCGTFC